MNAFFPVSLKKSKEDEQKNYSKEETDKMLKDLSLICLYPLLKFSWSINRYLPFWIDFEQTD